MQFRALTLFYDVCSEVLFKNKIDFNTCFDTYREKRYILHKTFECQMLCIRLDVNTTSEMTVQFWKCVNFLKTNCWYLLFPGSLLKVLTIPPFLWNSLKFLGVCPDIPTPPDPRLGIKFVQRW